MTDTPRFVIRKASNGQFYFFLRAANGEIVVTSETYVSKQGAQNGIQVVKTIAANAQVLDMTED